MNVYTKDGKSLISMVHGPAKISEMVRKSIDLIGGIEKINVKGKSVFVKPNMNSNNPPPAITNPVVIKTVVEILLDAGASEVTVGDLSNPNFETMDIMKDQGVKKAVESVGGKVISLDKDKFVRVDIPNGKSMTEVSIAKSVLEAEKLVLLPVIKTHNASVYSMSMKLIVGVISMDSRTSSHWTPSTKVLHSCPNISEAVAEISSLVNPDLIVMDGIKSFVYWGPSEGIIENTNIIVASGDRIANDIIGLSIIKNSGIWNDVVNKSVWEQEQIKRGLELGLGRGIEDISWVHCQL